MVDARVAARIEQADTAAKVWELVASLLGPDANSYSGQTYLENARAYAAVATSNA